MSTLQWPTHVGGQPLDDLRLNDDRLAAAYDATPAPWRACIKTGIALTYALHRGERPSSCEQSVEDAAHGFCYRMGRSPAPWTLLFFTSAYAAGPRLSAAFMPALLAGVPLVAACCVGGEPSVAARAVFELAGLEDVFCLTDIAMAQELLSHMSQQSRGRGRVLLLHAGELEPLRHCAHQQRQAVWEESAPPKVGHVPNSGHDAAILHWAHPDISLLPASDTMEEEGLDALFCPPHYKKERTLPKPPLLLEQGMEGFWWHPDLDPEFFQQKHLRAQCMVDRNLGEGFA